MIAKDTIPDDWNWTNVGKAFAFTNKPRELDVGKHPKVPFIPMDLIPIHRLYASDHVMKAPADLTSGTYFEAGDLLVSKITPCFENGKQAIITDLPLPFGYATTEVIPLKAVKSVSDLRFLFFYLMEPNVRAELAARMEGATGRQRLSKSVLEVWEMPLPPIEEQQVIVELLTQILDAIEVQDETIAILKELKAATMDRLFSDGAASWPQVSVSEYFDVGNGSTPSKTNADYWHDGAIPWITSSKVHDVFIRTAEQFVTAKAKDECHLPLVPKGSLVVAITGQGKTLGNAAKITFDTCINQHLAFLRPKGRDVVVDFLLAYLQTRYADLRQAGSSGGTTKGALTCGFLEKYPFPMPSHQEQRIIARTWRFLTRRIHVAERKRSLLEEMFNDSLSRLMSGSLHTTPLLAG